MRRLTFVCALAVPLLCAADWPQWRGPTADGVSTETGFPTESTDCNLGGRLSCKELW